MKTVEKIVDNVSKVDIENDIKYHIEKILIYRKSIGEKYRSVIFEMSDGNILEIFWDKRDQVTYKTYPAKDYSGILEMVREHDSYELLYKNGKIEEIVIPDFIRKEIEVNSSSAPPKEHNPTEIKSVAKKGRPRIKIDLSEPIVEDGKIEEAPIIKKRGRPPKVKE